MGDKCYIAARGENKLRGNLNRIEPVVVKYTRVETPKITSPVVASSDSSVLDTPKTSFSYHGPSSVVDFLSRSGTGQANLPFRGPSYPYFPSLIDDGFENSLSALINRLPSQILCDRLVDQFYTLHYLTLFYSIFHRPDFDGKYDNFWAYRRNLETGRGTEARPTVSFIALLASASHAVYVAYLTLCSRIVVLATGCQFLPERLSYLVDDGDIIKMRGEALVTTLRGVM